jgi:hypothetical protein
MFDCQDAAHFKNTGHVIQLVMLLRVRQGHFQASLEFPFSVPIPILLEAEADADSRVEVPYLHGVHGVNSSISASSLPDTHDKSILSS